MTQNAKTNRTNRETTPPDFIAYAVSEQGRGRKFWTRLGSVRKHKKGEGYNIYLNVLPIDFDGRVVLLPPKAEGEAPESQVDEAGDIEDGDAE